MIGLIVAVNPHGVIGVGGSIPWHYTLDLKRFREVTLNSAIIMGRKTWESIGSKPLKDRHNFVVSTTLRPVDSMCVAKTLVAAVEGALHEPTTTKNVWLIGGKSIYEEALKMGVVQMMDVTHVPDTQFGQANDTTYFRPEAFAHRFVRDYSVVHPDPRLSVIRYHRIDTLDAQVILKRHHISTTCRGHKCFCGKDATHKLGEEITGDDPFPGRHNLTAYVCCEHFTEILGPATGCKVVK